jgi:F0F1-type ATP synthase membrane subunit c/vacuolar-type H+-ATPase subunit K
MSLPRFPGTKADGIMAFVANLVVGLGVGGVGARLLTTTANDKRALWPVMTALGVVAVVAGTFSLLVGIKNLRARMAAWRQPLRPASNENG